MTTVLVGGNLPGALKKVKREYDSDVLPSVQRHRFAESPGQRKRRKQRRARKLAARRLAREERDQ